MDINEHFLAAVLQIFSNSADPARFLPPIYHQVPLTGYIFWRQYAGTECPTGFVRFLTAIWRHRFIDITDFVWYLLFCYQTLIAYSTQNLSLQVWLFGLFSWRAFLCAVASVRRSVECVDRRLPLGLLLPDNVLESFVGFPHASQQKIQIFSAWRMMQ